MWRLTVRRVTCTAYAADLEIGNCGVVGGRGSTTWRTSKRNPTQNIVNSRTDSYSETCTRIIVKPHKSNKVLSLLCLLDDGRAPSMRHLGGGTRKYAEACTWKCSQYLTNVTISKRCLEQLMAYLLFMDNLCSVTGGLFHILADDICIVYCHITSNI